MIQLANMDIAPERTEHELLKFDEFMQMYGSSTYGKLRRYTRNKHKGVIRSFLKSSEGKVTKQSVEQYLKPYVDSPFKWNHRLKALRVFCRDYMKLGIVDGLELQDEPQRAKSAPKIEALKAFYSLIPTLKLKVVFCLLASSGLRLNEILSLKVEDINLELRQIVPNVHLGRTKRSYYSFFNQEAEQILREYLAENGINQGRIFPDYNNSNVGRMFRQISQQARFKISAKMLRLYFSWRARKVFRMDVSIVRFLMGDAPLSVVETGSYSPWESVDELKEAYDSMLYSIFENAPLGQSILEDARRIQKEVSQSSNPIVEDIEGGRHRRNLDDLLP